jgi:hypothetical protein
MSTTPQHVRRNGERILQTLYNKIFESGDWVKQTFISREKIDVATMVTLDTCHSPLSIDSKLVDLTFLFQLYVNIPFYEWS